MSRLVNAFVFCRGPKVGHVMFSFMRHATIEQTAPFVEGFKQEEGRGAWLPENPLVMFICAGGHPIPDHVHLERGHGYRQGAHSIHATWP